MHGGWSWETYLKTPLLMKFSERRCLFNVHRRRLRCQHFCKSQNHMFYSIWITRPLRICDFLITVYLTFQMLSNMFMFHFMLCNLYSNMSSGFSRPCSVRSNSLAVSIPPRTQDVHFEMQFLRGMKAYAAGTNCPFLRAAEQLMSFLTLWISQSGLCYSERAQKIIMSIKWSLLW